ncbi:ankyrin repeat-containing domain protein, partial [Baffinella frigidus]
SARFGNLENVRRCLRMGKAMEQLSGSFDRTALFEAVLPNHFAVAQLLLQNGAVVTCVDNLGWTVLHSAALHGSKECASLLLDHGADMWKQTSFGITPLHFAASRNHLEMVQMLLSR